MSESSLSSFTSSEVTQLIAQATDEDGAVSGPALDRLFAIAYHELRSRAHHQRAGWAGAETLNTTALVHEAYEKILGSSEVRFENRAHFLAIASRAMRQVLLDYAKSQRALKRGGDRARVTLGDAEMRSTQSDPMFFQVIALSDAMDRLQTFNPEGARVVECRFFGGMTVEETAVALGVSEPTVKRRWRAARAWLHHALTAVADDDTQ